MRLRGSGITVCPSCSLHILTTRDNLPSLLQSGLRAAEGGDMTARGGSCRSLTKWPKDAASPRYGRKAAGRQVPCVVAIHANKQRDLSVFRVLATQQRTPEAPSELGQPDEPGSEMPETGTRPRTAEQGALLRTTCDHRNGPPGLGSKRSPSGLGWICSRYSAGIPILANRETSG